MMPRVPSILTGYAVSKSKAGHTAEVVLVNPEGFLVTVLKKSIPNASSEAEARYVSLLEGLKAANEHGIVRLHAYTDHRLIIDQTSRVSTGAGTDSEAYKQVMKYIDMFDSFKVYLIDSQDLNRAMDYAHVHSYDTVMEELEAESEKRENIPKNSEKMEILPKTSDLKEPETEQCIICCDDRACCDMITIKHCGHRFCKWCLIEHVKAKMESGIFKINCLGGDCLQIFDIEQCESFLPNDCYQKLLTALAEAEVPEAKRIYCPFPNCSALMERDDTVPCPKRSQCGNSRKPAVCRAECLECHRLFCTECKVPWHKGLTCATYKTLKPARRNVDERKLYALAQKKKWKSCPQCHTIIELSYGCYHMTCRCGVEFCFRCLAKYRSKKPTCKCPLFDEENLLLRRVPRR